ncbi:MAG: hypothetical protein HY675_08180 [Chloroflexi bacterium]|nr:hypothetical protein [Chloroflexota bacterium]
MAAALALLGVTFGVATARSLVLEGSAEEVAGASGMDPAGAVGDTAGMPGVGMGAGLVVAAWVAEG